MLGKKGAGTMKKVIKSSSGKQEERRRRRRRRTPSGSFPVYVGESQQRFVVPTRYLSHPLLKIMLEKARDEFGFAQGSGLLIPCSVEAFHQLITAVECCDRRFQFGELVDDFIH